MYCPRCGTEIDESSRYCKYCGARVGTDAPETAPEPSDEQREGVPTYDMPRMMRPDMMEKFEKIIFETHPSKMGTLFNHIATAIIFAVIGFVLLIRFDWWIPAVVLIGLGLIVALVGYIKWRSVVYVLTTNRILVLRGIFAKELYENRLSKVQDIRMKISLRQRLYNCGDIYLTTAGTAGVECLWQDIPDPRRKEALVRKLVPR